jgi:hypothetical protein
MKKVLLRRIPPKVLLADNPDEYAEIIIPRNLKRFQGFNPGDSFESLGKENFLISYPKKFPRNFLDFILEIARLRQAISKGELG